MTVLFVIMMQKHNYSQEGTDNTKNKELYEIDALK